MVSRFFTAQTRFRTRKKGFCSEANMFCKKNIKTVDFVIYLTIYMCYNVRNKAYNRCRIWIATNSASSREVGGKKNEQT